MDLGIHSEHFDYGKSHTNDCAQTNHDAVVIVVDLHLKA